MVFTISSLLPWMQRRPQKMQLLILPEEMIANVMKYARFGTLTRIRKINSQIDRISIRYEINQPRVDELTIHQHRRNIVGIRFLKKELFEKKKRGYCEYKFPGGKDLISKIEEILGKIRIRSFREFKLIYVALDVKWMKLLQNIKYSKRTHITLSECFIYTGLTNFVNTMNKFQSSEITGFLEIEVFPSNDGLPKDEMLCALLPTTTISIRPCVLYEIDPGGIRTPGVTNVTLRMLQTIMPRSFSLDLFKTSFTMKEVFNTINILKENEKVLPGTNWNLGRIMFDSIEEIKHMISRLRAIKGCHIDGENKKVVFLNKKRNIKLEFELCI